MSKAEKLLKRFLSKPKDFTYDPAVLPVLIFLYPNPKPELKRYQLDYIEEELRSRGVNKMKDVLSYKGFIGSVHFNAIEKELIHKS